MSCPVTKAERSKAKDARQQLAPEPVHIKTKSKRPRPFSIEHRYTSFFSGEMSKWYVVGRYRTERERDDALDDMLRKAGRFANSRWRQEYRVGPTKEK